MDVRYTGYHLHLLEQLATWAKSQTRNYLWDRNARFYIPAVHGSYDDFAEDERLLSENEPWGPLPIANFNTSSPPDEDWGVGEEADLITLFPIFDPAGTVWPYRNHILNHNSSEAAKPRRVSINTFTRLSRRLLLAMHADNIDGRSMFSEMWPATAAVQHGLKAVYVPHPVFLEQRWPTHKLESVFNAGPTGHVGGSLETVTNQEYQFKGATWFWNARFSRTLYRRWLGKAESGPGSPGWEEEHGEMCLPGILLHPVKAMDVEGAG